MLNVLVVGDNPSRLGDQIFLCKELLKVNSSCKFIFLICDISFITLFTGLPKKISYVLVGQPHKLPQNKTQQLKNTSKNYTRIIRKSLPFFIYESIAFILIIFDLWRNYFRIYEIIREIKPNLIVANADRNHGIEQIVLKIAKELKIKTIIPYLVYSDNVGLAELRSRNDFFNNRMKNSFFTKVIIKLFPRQTYNYKGEKYLFHPPSFIIAYKLFGTLSNDLWYVGNGLSDIVCVDSKYTYDRYKKNGVPEDKLTIIGDFATDKVYRNYYRKKEIKDFILNKYHFNNTKKNIIISLPQLAEMDFIDRKTHWREINYLVETLERMSCNILISLHPRMNPHDYKFLEKKYKCQIVSERLFEIMPIADLFVSTYSSTVIWAVLSEVKCVIVDFYNLHYSMYDFLTSISIVKKKESLLHVLKESLTEQSRFSSDWEKLSRASIFDGKTIQRYNILFQTQSSFYLHQHSSVK